LYRYNEQPACVTELWLHTETTQVVATPYRGAASPAGRKNTVTVSRSACVRVVDIAGGAGDKGRHTPMVGAVQIVN
jgi:hypothetical protein